MITLMLLACGQPAHMQYDFGRSFNESIAVQSTRDRASVATDAYGIGGAEALRTRENARKAATDTEKGIPTITASVETKK